MLPRFVIVALLWLFAAGPVVPSSVRLPGSVEDAIEQVSADELRGYVSVLASDSLAGRGVGDAGNRQAEQYIVASLKAAHVPPALSGYLQPVEVYQPALGRAARLRISAGTDVVGDLSTGSDFLPLPESSDHSASGPVVFAGYGISAPDLKHDDYARVNAAGAIVLVVDDMPDAIRRVTSLSTDEKAAIGGLDRKMQDAKAHGASGMLVIRRYPGSAEYFWPEHPSVRSANYRLYAAMRSQPLAVAAISEHAADPVRRALDQGRRVTASFNPDVIARPIVINNILGMVEGRQAPQEMVVVGAHLDHDGTDESGQIYNGADDNASGTAAVVAIAAALQRAAAHGARPARTVVFALWNGEEKGSLGAEFYVQYPAPARTIVADINLDMVGREEEIPDPNNFRFRGFEKTSADQNRNVVHLLGYSYAPDLARAAERANDSVHLTIKEDYDHDAQSLVRRSDNWPFLERRIPAVFLTTGLHPDYHTPDDDTDRIDFPKLERIAELAGRLAWIVADGDTPRFKTR
jgi:hypothetical protein